MDFYLAILEVRHFDTQIKVRRTFLKAMKVLVKWRHMYDNRYDFEEQEIPDVPFVISPHLRRETVYHTWAGDDCPCMFVEKWNLSNGRS